MLLCFFSPFRGEKSPIVIGSTQGTSWWRWPRCWDLTWHRSDTRRAELVSLSCGKIVFFSSFAHLLIHQYLLVGVFFHQPICKNMRSRQIGFIFRGKNTRYLSCHHLEWAWCRYTSINQPPNLTRHMSKWRLRHSIVKPSLPELHGTPFFESCLLLGTCHKNHSRGAASTKPWK